MGKGPSLSLSQLSVCINGVELLAPIDHQFESGMWHGIVGPNGGGKSTLLKALAGLLPHTGQISIQWTAVDGREVGYMPQLAPFDASLPVSVADFIRINQGPRSLLLGWKKSDVVRQLIEQLQLKPLLNKRVGNLSTGERQRVLLCAALLKKPSLLLLDEPLAGMDAQGQERVLQVLQDFKSQGGTLIMIEHNWQVLEDYSDQICFIQGGLRKVGSAREVLIDPAQKMAVNYA